MVNKGDQFNQLKGWKEQSGIWAGGPVLQIRNLSDVAFNAKGTLLATGSRDGAVQLWDPATGAGKGYQNCKTPVSQVVFSPEGGHLLIRTEDRTALLWEMGTGMPVTLRGHTGDILDVAFGADGQTVATASADGTARVWDAVAKAQKSIPIPGGLVASKTNAVFTRDSKYVIVAGVDNHIRIVEAATGELAGELSGDTGPIAAMALSFDGTKLAVASTRMSPEYGKCRHGRSGKSSLDTARRSPPSRSVRMTGSSQRHRMTRRRGCSMSHPARNSPFSPGMPAGHWSGIPFRRGPPRNRWP